MHTQNAINSLSDGVNAAYKSQDLLHQPGLERASTGMPDQPTTYAATQLRYKQRTVLYLSRGGTLHFIICIDCRTVVYKLYYILIQKYNMIS